MKIKRYFLAMLLVFAISIVGCTPTKDHTTPNTPPSDNPELATTWNEERVYAFLEEVNLHVRQIPYQTNSKEAVIQQYEQYFSPELSETIFNSLYDKTDTGWLVPDSDAGLIFVVLGKSNESSATEFEFKEDSIRIRETYDMGMYNAIEYTISFDTGKPIITDWIRE
ncbi:hypothetical protein BHU72_01635 [Desulfuribacillus stibiiarsenatis]|uniref:DUF3993 domain-containing protein n=1 Tax=Desulfuribacillus stibiiarsenatis TaxID=1390249 RepID=A0A1E5LAF7_9FIRM|nr:hypothetical protein [Desulfuribacillus stibiiarsenatis]OEH86983.1 hypothetical protein BHU72_01635 [Desulfuribacillus stibiiarsenatis]